MVKLLEMCCRIDPEFSSLSLEAATLSPFATEFRYPVEDVEDENTVERKVVVEAINHAKKILAFVISKISLGR